jgi:hypothetical protein
LGNVLTRGADLTEIKSHRPDAAFALTFALFHLLLQNFINVVITQKSPIKHSQIIIIIVIMISLHAKNITLEVTTLA